MQKGSYRKKINFREFEVSRFIPCLYDPLIYESSGCGYCALATLTAHDPIQIRKLNNNNDHCSERFLLSYLKKNEFKIERLTLSNLSNTRSNTIYDNIHSYNVVLALQQYKRNERSYTIMWNNLVIHNFQIYPLKALELLNRPIVSAWLIKHKQYL